TTPCETTSRIARSMRSATSASRTSMSTAGVWRVRMPVLSAFGYALAHVVIAAGSVVVSVHPVIAGRLSRDTALIDDLIERPILLLGIDERWQPLEQGAFNVDIASAVLPEPFDAFRVLDPHRRARRHVDVERPAHLQHQPRALGIFLMREGE